MSEHNYLGLQAMEREQVLQRVQEAEADLDKAKAALREIVVEAEPKATPGGIAVIHTSARDLAAIARATLKELDK